MVKVFKIKISLLKLFLFIKTKERIVLNIFSVVLVTLICLPFITFPINAAQTGEGPYVSSNLADWIGSEGDCDTTNNGKVITTPIVTENSGYGNGKLIGGITSAVTNRIIGCWNQEIINGEVKNEKFASGGAISVGAGALNTLYLTPTSSFAYQMEQTVALISPVKNVEAQSLSGAPTGASVLQFVKSLHQSVSNIVYIVYVFIFIIISITILLRKKINGQEFVNIMNFIPRIIISLILVIFSYSISGLMIDLSNVGMGVVYDVFVNQIKNNSQQTVATVFPSLVQYNLQPFHQDMSVFRIFGVSQQGSNFNFGVGFVKPDFGPSNGVVTTLAEAITVIAGQGTSGLSGILGLILAVGALSSMFKIFFALLKDFLTLLFYPILAPIQFALVVFPGQEKGAIEWARTMLGSSITFVVMYAVFFLIFLLGKNFFNIGGNQVWNPPLLGFTSSPSASFLSSLAAYGLYVVSAGIPDMVKGALKVEGGAFGKIGAQLSQTTKSAASKVSLGLIK